MSFARGILGTSAALAVAAGAVAGAAMLAPASAAAGGVAHHLTAASARSVVVAPSAAVTPVRTKTLVAAPIWNIQIATTGYQHELNTCVWVRMNFVAVAPIVGAHNNCGGDIVLRMAAGDIVNLTGTGLTGSYVVLGGRDAWSGEKATMATAGFRASVILQTCYYNGNGRERLVQLVPRVDTVLPSTVS